MKKNLLLFGIVIGLSLTCNHSLEAQNETVANKIIYAELCGPGVVMSANFDGRFSSKSNLGLGYRFGIGFGFNNFQERIYKLLFDETYEISIEAKEKGSFYTFPVGLNYVAGKPGKALSFEAGAGVTILSHKAPLYNIEYHKPGNIIGYISLMGRIAPAKGGMSFRFGITPIIGTSGDLLPIFAFSLGYAF